LARCLYYANDFVVEVRYGHYQVWRCDLRSGKPWYGAVRYFVARFIQKSKCFTLDELPGMYFPWYTRMSVELWRPLRQYVYQRDKGLCQYCGTQVELIKCHIHHVLELSESGTNYPTNLKTLCVPCHKDRHPHMNDSLLNMLCVADKQKVIADNAPPPQLPPGNAPQQPVNDNANQQQQGQFGGK
jgi:hypothetical protein